CGRPASLPYCHPEQSEGSHGHKKTFRESSTGRQRQPIVRERNELRHVRLLPSLAGLVLKADSSYSCGTLVSSEVCYSRIMSLPRYTDRLLPAYRFIPGQSPHPRR